MIRSYRTPGRLIDFRAAPSSIQELAGGANLCRCHCINNSGRPRSIAIHYTQPGSLDHIQSAVGGPRHGNARVNCASRVVKRRRSNTAASAPPPLLGPSSLRPMHFSHPTVFFTIHYDQALFFLKESTHYGFLYTLFPQAVTGVTKTHHPVLSCGSR